MEVEHFNEVQKVQVVRKQKGSEEPIALLLTTKIEVVPLETKGFLVIEVVLMTRKNSIIIEIFNYKVD